MKGKFGVPLPVPVFTQENSSSTSQSGTPTSFQNRFGIFFPTADQSPSLQPRFPAQNSFEAENLSPRDLTEEQKSLEILKDESGSDEYNDILDLLGVKL